MAENKNKVIVYRDWIGTFEGLTDEEAGKLIKHFFRYINDQNPESPDRLTTLLFEPIRQTLKRDLKAYEAKCLINKANIDIRWKDKNTTVYKRKKSNTNYTDSDSGNDNGIDNETIVNNYHSLCPNMAKVIALNDTRKGYINARFAEYGMETITKVLRMAGESDFLNGKNDKAWKADFEWIMRPQNFLKVLEGKYDNKGAKFMMP